MNLSSLLGVLPIVGPAIAAAPEFKRLFDEATAALKSDQDQATAKQAYDLALGNAANAHTALQDLVRRHAS